MSTKKSISDAKDRLYQKKDEVSSQKEESTAPKKPKRPLGLRILFVSLKTLLLWIPLGIITLIILALLIANIVLSPGRVEKIAVEKFNAMSNGTLTLDVKKFSPYSDILMENIKIKNPKEYGDTVFFEMKRFHLKYGLFSLLIGKVHFDEIELLKPRVYLLQQNGVWNAAVLMKPTPPKEIVPEEPEVVEPSKEPSEPRDMINLPWSMRFFFNFVLEDFYVYMRGENFKTELGGVTFKVKINVPPFKHIPLSAKAVSLLKDMEISFIPDERIALYFSSQDAAVEPPLVCTWKLQFKKENGETRFDSKFRFGTYKTPVRFKRTHLAPLDFLVSYDLYYDPINDYVKLNDFGVRFKNSDWIKLGGTVAGVTKKPVVDISMIKSQISLADLYPYYRALTGDSSMRFAGTISLAPLSVKGTPDNLAVKGGIGLRSIALRMPAVELNLPKMDLLYSLNMVGANAVIGAEIDMQRFSYKLDRSLSGANSFNLKADVRSSGNFSHFNIRDVAIKYYNPNTQANALFVGIRGNASTAPSISGSVSLYKFSFDKNALLPMLNDPLRVSLGGIPFTKPVTGSLDSSFSLGSKTHAKVLLALRVPDFDVNDLTLRADVTQNPAAQRIDVHDVTLRSPSKGLTMTLKGMVEMKTAPLSDSNLSFKLALDYPRETNIWGPWKIKGGVSVSAAMRGDLAKGLAKGSVKINHFNVKNDESMLEVSDANLDFPFEYDFAYKPEGGSRIAVSKNTVIDSAIFRERDNLSIKTIYAKHPARDLKFAFVKDFHGALFFRKNAFEIQKLSMNVLDGTVYAKDILFYLSDMNMRNMEYGLTLDVTNVDVGLLDDPDPKNKKRNAELSLNAKFYGDDLVDYNVDGYINIFKIGKKFASRLLDGLSKEDGKSKIGISQWIVDHSYSVKSYNFYLGDGTMYTTVLLDRRLLGYFVPVSIKDNKIEFTRIPIKQYLKNMTGGK